MVKKPMMQKYEFNEAIALISGAFPRRTYSAEQLTRLYEEMKNLTAHQFVSTIETLLDTTPYFPTLHAIRQACRPLLDRVRGDLKTFSDCNKCHGTGQYDYAPEQLQKPGYGLTRYAIACPYCHAAETRKLNPAYFPRVPLDKFLRNDLFMRKLQANEMKKGPFGPELHT